MKCSFNFQHKIDKPQIIRQNKMAAHVKNKI